MLAIKSSRGIAPEVNAVAEAHRKGINPGFETLGRHHHKDELCPRIFFLKKVLLVRHNQCR